MPDALERWRVLRLTVLVRWLSLRSVTFHWWNVAQLAALRATNKTKRAFTINRSFSPGMQRLGAAVWTGDIHSSWAELARTGSYL
jgi:alpha-glucosidase (family GH31 glycosyl hydrolase)